MIDKDVEQRIYEHTDTLDSEEKVKRGVVYTPLSIVGCINSKIITELSPSADTNFRVLDLSCGTGVFLIDMLYRLRKQTDRSFKHIIENSLYGFDIDELAIKKAKKILEDIAGVPVKCNLFHGSALDRDFVLQKLGDKAQVVVGNPPYVKIQNMSEADKGRLGSYKFVSGNTDLYIVFYELGLEFLEKDGMLGYVSSNTFLKNKSGRKLCEHLLEERLIWELIDFKDVQVFENFSTYTCVCILKNSGRPEFYRYMEPNPEKMQSFSCEEQDFLGSWKKYNKTTPENISISNKNVEIIKKLENAGDKLIDLFHIRVGLATLADRVFMFGSPTCEDEYFLYFGGDKIERGILKRCVKASTVKTEKALRESHGHIIFPYDIKNDKACLMPEEVLYKKYPMTFEYLCRYKRDVLEKRDKGVDKGYKWYEYGRTQGLNSLWGEKLLLSPLTQQPVFVQCKDKDMLYVSGYALFPKDGYDLLLAKRVLESAVMKRYVEARSKKMRAGYNVYSKEFIKNFSIPGFTKAEIKTIKSCGKEQLDSFLFSKYAVAI